ncbi:hypothetical protein NITGR_1050036 [Nitrospina gracilis 3/211]|uniref:Tetratricopeptide repeat protein n=1 Tax=Nitrospina gracilis (strain 3/211) TaxID=1266370 RepID=M1YG82_NITG3|nr:hypothetical protein NITGR_1050036 [Nitrospina gracilis 3/211]
MEFLLCKKGGRENARFYRKYQRRGKLMIATNLFLKGKKAQIEGRLDEALEWFQKSLAAN